MTPNIICTITSGVIKQSEVDKMTYQIKTNPNTNSQKK
jgi:hypothetical protein